MALQIVPGLGIDIGVKKKHADDEGEEKGDDQKIGQPFFHGVTCFRIDRRNIPQRKA